MRSHFSTKHLMPDLHRLSARGGVVTFAGQIVKFLLNILTVMILARILSPQDHGLIAMVTSLTGFILIFKDLGLSMATIQQAEINHEQISTLFWLNVALGLLLTFLTLIISPLVGWFYGDSRLVLITAVLSVGFLLGGMAVQHQALLRRQMRFSALAFIDVLSMAVGLMLAVAFAYSGFGYWALVWLQLVMTTVTVLGVWLASGWVPSLPSRHSGVSSMVKFGGYLTGFNLVNYFARNLDQILIGRFTGAEMLGLYSRAYSLLLFPIGQITAPMTAVALPALSRLQHNPDDYRRYYLNAIRIIAYLAFPTVMALVVLSREVVLLVLGDQWLEVVPIFRILAIAAIFQPILSTVGWLYISMGNSRRMATWGLFASVAISISFIIGLTWGAIGVATSYAVCMTLLIHPQIRMATYQTALTAKDIYKTMQRPFFLSFVFAVGMIVTSNFFQVQHPVLTVIVTTLGGLLALITSLILWPSARKEVFQMIFGIRSLLGQRSDVNLKSS